MPTTTTGVATSFIDFTRASNATVTDSDGKVKWAPHNLLTNSESFDAASWGSKAYVTANAAVAPNGTTTADRINNTGAADNVAQTAAVAPGVAYTFSFWAKNNGGTTANYRVYDASNSADIVAVTSYFSSINSSTWSLITVSFTAPSGCTSAVVYIAATNGSTNNIFVWGASLYRSDLGGMQPNTSAYPMYNPTTVKNALGYTEDFSNGAWVKGGATVTANSAIAPNGLQTADTISFPANVFTYQSVSFALQSGKPYTLSFYVRADAATDINIGINGNSSSLTNKATNVSVGTTWQRVSFSSTGAATEALVYVGLGTSAIGTGATLINDTRTIYVWGAQLSDSASLDPYVPVYGAAVTSAAYYGPRRDFDPVTLACKGLLVEEQRANLLLNSAAFDAASWTQTGVTIAANVAGATAVAPDGTNTADKWQETAGGSGHALTESASVTTGVTYTLSVYAKAAENSYVGLFGLKNSVGKLFNLANGTVGNNLSAAPAASGIYPVGNGWYRCWIQDTEIATTSRSFQIYSSKNGTNWDYSGTLNDGIYLWGAQVEAGSFATSYIPTGAATATRNADVASVSTQAFPYGSTEGTLVVAHDFLDGQVSSTNNIYPAGLADSTNKSVASFYGSGRLIMQTPSTQLGTDLGYTTSISKIGVAFTGTSQGSSKDGAAAVSSTLPIDASLASKMLLSGAGFGSNVYCGHIRQITYLPRRISNAELVTRST